LSWTLFLHARISSNQIVSSVQADTFLYITAKKIKSNRPSTLTGRNVRLSNLLISSCQYIETKIRKSFYAVLASTVLYKAVV